MRAAQLVVITDDPANTSASSAIGEEFYALCTAAFGEMLRGISFTPSGDSDNNGDDHGNLIGRGW